jgi:hypothetical protein
MLKQGGKVKSIIHEVTAEVHSNMLRFGENEPDKVEEICTAAQTKTETPSATLLKATAGIRGSDPSVLGEEIAA